MRQAAASARSLTHVPSDLTPIRAVGAGTGSMDTPAKRGGVRLFSAPPYCAPRALSTNNAGADRMATMTVNGG